MGWRSRQRNLGFPDDGAFIFPLPHQPCVSDCAQHGAAPAPDRLRRSGGRGSIHRRRMMWAGADHQHRWPSTPIHSGGTGCRATHRHRLRIDASWVKHRRTIAPSQSTVGRGDGIRPVGSASASFGTADNRISRRSATGDWNSSCPLDSNISGHRSGQQRQAPAPH